MAFAGTGTDVIGGHTIAGHALTFESTFAAGLGVENWIGTVTNFTRQRIDNNHYRHGLSAYSHWYDATLMNRRWEGTIELEVNNGAPYALALGAVDGTADPLISSFRGYGHVSGAGDFDGTPAKEFMPSFAFAVETTDGEVKGVKGATVTSATFTVSNNNEPNRCTLNYVAQAEDATDITGATAETNVYGFNNTDLEYDDVAAFSAKAQTITDWTESTVTITPQLDVEPSINAATIRQPRFKGFGKNGCTWALTRYLSDDDFWSTTDFPATIAASFRLKQYIGAADYIYADLQNVKLDNIEEGVDQEGLAMHRMNFNARYMSVDVADDVTYIAWD